MQQTRELLAIFPFLAVSSKTIYPAIFLVTSRLLGVIIVLFLGLARYLENAYDVVANIRRMESLARW